MSLNWGHILRFILLVLLPVGLILLGLVLLKQILLPFLVGLAAAYMLDPAADRLERLRFSRATATTLITIGFFLVLAIIVLLLLPPLASQAAALAGDLPGYVERLRDRLLPLLTSLIDRFNYGADLSAEGLIRQQAGQAIGVFVRSVTGLLQSGVAFLNLVALIFVTPIVTFYMLRDWDHMVAQFRSLVPPKNRDAADRLGREIDEVLAGFLRGQGLVCTFLAVFYAIGLWAVDLNYGLIIGLLTGFFSFVPFIGMAVGMAVGVAVAAFQVQQECGLPSPAEPCSALSQWKIPIVIGIFALGQFIEGNLISPRLVGSRIHLHPVWVIFAVLAGTTLFGILGTLLAVPFAAVMGVLIRFGLERYQDSSLFNPPDDKDQSAAIEVSSPSSVGPSEQSADEQKTGTIG